MEDQALLADEDTGGERAGHRLMAQPSVIKGGQMRMLATCVPQMLC